MSRTILIATHNPGKLREIREVLDALPYTFVSLVDLNITEDIEETGVTHEENATLKARFFSEKTGLPTIGEDSGIYVDAFPGEFGVYTRRWHGLGAATDEEWIAAFLIEIQKIPPEKRTARFVCCAAYVENPTAPPLIVTGETPGVITDTLRAPLTKGIPVSSCFIPDGLNAVYAALSLDEKNSVSHRGKAMKQLRDMLC